MFTHFGRVNAGIAPLTMEANTQLMVRMAFRKMGGNRFNSSTSLTRIGAEI
jgi:hypothetical protein